MTITRPMRKALSVVAAGGRIVRTYRPNTCTTRHIRLVHQSGATETLHRRTFGSLFDAGLVRAVTVTPTIEHYPLTEAGAKAVLNT